MEHLQLKIQEIREYHDKIVATAGQMRDTAITSLLREYSRPYLGREVFAADQHYYIVLRPFTEKGKEWRFMGTLIRGTKASSLCKLIPADFQLVPDNVR